MIATVSNWGAFGLLAALESASAGTFLPSAHAYEEFLDHIVALGAVDGMNGAKKKTVDGQPLKVDIEILEQLRSTVRS